MPCFAKGTKIATKRGEVLIEDLTAGDKVLTRDNGYQRIRRISETTLSARQQLDNPHLKPVIVQVGAYGDNLPRRDTRMSQNTRLAVIEQKQGLLSGEVEEFVALKHLVDNKAVQQVDTISITYFHLGFARHQVVAANGLWAEAFQPADRSLGVLGNAQRLEVLELFPALSSHCRPKQEIRAVRRVNRLKFASGF